MRSRNHRAGRRRARESPTVDPAQYRPRLKELPEPPEALGREHAASRVPDRYVGASVLPALRIIAHRGQQQIHQAREHKARVRAQLEAETRSLTADLEDLQQDHDRVQDDYERATADLEQARDRVRRDRGEEHQLHRSRTSFARWLIWPLVLFFAGTEALLLYPIFLVVFGVSAALTLWAAVGVAVGFAIVEAMGGYMLRRAQHARDRVVAVLCALAFVALAAAIYYVSVIRGAQYLADLTALSSGVGAPPVLEFLPTGSATATGLFVALSAVYACAAAILGYLHFTPSANGLRRVERERRRQRRRLTEVRERIEELTEKRAKAQSDLDNLDEMYAELEGQIRESSYADMASYQTALIHNNEPEVAAAVMESPRPEILLPSREITYRTAALDNGESPPQRQLPIEGDAHPDGFHRQS